MNQLELDFPEEKNITIAYFESREEEKDLDPYEVIFESNFIQYQKLFPFFVDHCCISERESAK